MNIYTCPTCAKDFKTERSLRSHLNWHKPGYAEKSIAGAHSSKEIRTLLITQRSEAKIAYYFLNPVNCQHCNIILPYDSRSNKFCSRSCSATYNNCNRDGSVYEKQKLTLSETIAAKPPKAKKPKAAKQCTICKSTHTKSGRTCSSKCFSALHSAIKKESIASGKFNPRLNRNGRRKQSYMEEGFEMWLKENKVSGYYPEHHVKRYDDEGKFVKNYFIDFYFPELNLAIELDGTQHKFTIEKDQDRDNYLSCALGMTVFRIPYAAFQKNEWIETVKELLNL
jgi:very-short-patch-repair endonuclease